MENIHHEVFSAKPQCLPHRRPTLPKNVRKYEGESNKIKHDAKVPRKV